MNVLRYIALLTASSSLGAAGTLDIYFIDVDWGNAVLIATPSGQAMMFDTGQPGQKYVNRILTVIQKAGVKQLDYVVTSHYHSDHVGNVPELAGKIPILNYVDHGPDVSLGRNKFFDDYAKAREKGKHIVAKPGDYLPLKDVEVTILASAGKPLIQPLPGAGQMNSACAVTQSRFPDVGEDSQSVGKLVTYGKFRYADFGDLSWDKSYRLFCPMNMIGTVDAYLITHHGINYDMSAGPVEWSHSGAPPAEVWALHPRVAFLSAGEEYPGRIGTPEAWQTTHRSPGLEDIWQIHYQTQGGKANNSSDRFIANPNIVGDQGCYIKLSAKADGSFTVTNSRNGYTKRYPARQAVMR